MLRYATLVVEVEASSHQARAPLERPVQFEHEGDDCLVKPSHRGSTDTFDGVLTRVNDLEEIGNEVRTEPGLVPRIQNEPHLM